MPNAPAGCLLLVDDDKVNRLLMGYYLTKPVNQVLLRARINASLEKKRLRDQQTHLLLRLERELEIARQTQQSILPDHLPEREGYDFGARMIPARVVGGDFYEFISLDNEHLGVVIGDVTDKGLPAALFMALTYSLVSVDAMQTGSPAETIRNVNRHLLSMNAAGMFVTLLYGILDYPTGQLRYARAGHLVPIVIDPVGQTVKIPVNTGQPLGLFKDPQGDEFGYQRLYETLSQHRQQPAQAICEQLWLAVQTHASCSQPQDDFTTVVIKRFDSPV